jgi:hypothetical protein
LYGNYAPTAKFDWQKAVADALLFVTLAFVVAAHFNDASRNRFIGFGVTFLIGYILPTVLLVGYLAVLPKPAWNLLGMIRFVVLLPLLIWASTRPQPPQLSAASSDGPAM